MKKETRISFSKKDEAFTLLELTIVIVVIGILTSIALPILNNYQREAIAATVKSDIRSSVHASIKKMDGGGVFVDEETFVQNATVTKGNAVVLVVTNRGSNEEIGCIHGSHVFGENDVVSYHYSSETGKIGEGSCFEQKPDNTEIIVGTSPTDTEENNPEVGGDHHETNDESPVVTNPEGSSPNGENDQGSVPQNPNVEEPKYTSSKNKYPVCHHTGNDNYHLLMLPFPAINQGGHGTVHGKDIIPPISGTHSYPGKNWDAPGWKIFTEKCS